MPHRMVVLLFTLYMIKHLHSGSPLPILGISHDSGYTLNCIGSTLDYSAHKVNGCGEQSRFNVAGSNLGRFSVRTLKAQYLAKKCPFS